MSKIANFTQHRVSVTPAFENDPGGGFRTKGEFYSAVLLTGKTGRVTDERLMRLKAAAGSDEQGAYSDPHGGFLIPVAHAPTTLTVATEDPTVTTPLTMGSSVVTVPARNDKDHTTSVSGGLICYRNPETVAIPSSRMQIEQLTFTAKTLAGLSYVTDILIADSAQSIPTILNVCYSHERNAAIIREKISGTGVGEYHGVVNSGCVISVPKEGSQAAGSILSENLEKMESRCWHYNRSVWLSHPDLKDNLKQLVRTIGTSGVAIPYLTYAPDGQELLSGRPIHFTDQCEAPGTSGDIVLGVWSEYVEGVYKPLEMASSIHVRFEARETAFRFLERGDAMAWWRVPLTQRNSAITVSPFVVLADRA